MSSRPGKLFARRVPIISRPTPSVNVQRELHSSHEYLHTHGSQYSGGSLTFQQHSRWIETSSSCLYRLQAGGSSTGKPFSRIAFGRNKRNSPHPLRPSSFDKITRDDTFSLDHRLFSGCEQHGSIPFSILLMYMLVKMVFFFGSQTWFVVFILQLPVLLRKIKGDVHVPGKYRDITLLSQVLTLLERVLHALVRRRVKGEFGEEHQGLERGEEHETGCTSWDRCWRRDWMFRAVCL